MRLSVVFELLLVFLFLAFAAARVIDPKKSIKNVAKENKKVTTLRQGPPNRYCACTSRMCNCCRDFSLPVVPLKGPGCASIMYVQRDTMMVTMTFGDRVLSNTTITGKTPKPVCMALPGGISQFCGRVYGISRKGDQFRACLGLELRALDDIEAALRVSCFKFGPKGVRLESAPPVPSESGGKDPEEEDEEDYDLDDDEDDDLIGFGVDDDDEGASSEDNEVDSDSVDYTGFSVLGEDLLGTLFSDDSGSSAAKKKKPTKKTAKPQVVIPKISTTTRKPILPNRRRSTVKPLQSLVTKRPLINRVTKRPANRPHIIQRPSVSVNIMPQTAVNPTVLPTSSTFETKYDFNKNIVTKSPVSTTESPPTTTWVSTTSSVQESQKFQTSEEVNHEFTVVTEEPITFTIPAQKIEEKNDIKLTQTDLDKVEAVAAIAQQDVTSGVISSGSLTSEETEKPVEITTAVYEKISPSTLLETSSFYTPELTEKISSIKFVPTTVVTSRPSAELTDGHDPLNEVTKPSEFELVRIQNKVTVPQHSTVSTLSVNKKQENDEDKKEVSSIEENSITKTGNVTVSLKKQPVKKKPVKEKEEKEEEEEEEEEEEDLLEGVLSDDDENDNDEAEDNDENPNKNKNEVDKDDDEESEDGDDSLEETQESSQKVKPIKVSIKEKPSSDESDNKDEEEEEEEEEEEDILDVLGDDDEEDESDDDEDDNEAEKEKNKRKTTTQKPSAPKITQTKQPVTITEKVSSPITIKESATEKVTEKVFTLKESVEKATEKVYINNEPEKYLPNKVFVFTEPENQILKKTTEKIIFYKEPDQQSVTEKFIIYKEPEEKLTEKPTINIQNNKFTEVVKNESDEEDKNENNDENSSEEEDLDDDNESEQHTFVASIAKPEFSNKYAEEHDLTENDDLSIEDSEDETSDFEEDRKMKENRKKPNAKPFIVKKSETQVNKPKVLTLSDLIGQRKTYTDDKPISTSRTHRRMNLDRFLQVS